MRQRNTARIELAHAAAVAHANRGYYSSLHQPLGFRPRGWADLVAAGGETMAELVDRHGSELLELPR